MQYVIQLYGQQKLLSKSETYNMLNDEHVLQLIGLYRLFLKSSDWETLLQNACSLRQQINEVLFVNAFMLAIRDRPDTQYVIIPGLNEILPHLFYSEDIIKTAELSNSTTVQLEDKQLNHGLDIFMLDTGMRTFCDQLAARFQLASVDFIRQNGSYHSLAHKPQQFNAEQKLYSELLLNNLQQIMARMNMERISFKLPSLSDGLIRQTVTRFNKTYLLQKQNIWYAVRLNEKRLNDLHKRLILQKLNEFGEMLKEIQVMSEGILSTRDIDHLVGWVLKDKLVDIKRAVLTEIYEIRDYENIPLLSNVGYFMSEPIAQFTLEAVVKLFNSKRRELKAYSKKDLEFQGVKITEIQADKFYTYDELVNVDMINIDTSKEHLFVSEKRLNHKDFNIKVNVYAEKQQKAILRILMTTVLDSAGNLLPINDIQLDTMALHAIAVDLLPGNNTLEINSNDIAWTMRDTTYFSNIFKNVNLAIENKLTPDTDYVYQQQCAFPHRLLLPRGRKEGLPMKLIAIISPVTPEDYDLQQKTKHQQICSVGTSSLYLDHLPLLYPMDRQLESLDDLIVPNIMFKDIEIYHNE